MEEGEEPRWEPDRLNALADGVFAIAMTLLALEVRIPAGISTRAGFRAALPSFFLQLAVFGLGFFLIAQFWLRQHWVMHHVKCVDRRAVRRTVLLLAGVASLPIAIDLVTHDAQFREAVTIAAVMLALPGISALWLESALLRPGFAEIEPHERQVLRIRGRFAVGVILLAIPLAYLLPTSALAPIAWLLLAIGNRVSARISSVWERLREGRRGPRRGRPAREDVRREP